jgi:hypothetical protein
MFVIRVAYDWDAIQALIDTGTGFAAAHRAFGISHYTWTKAIVAGLIRVDLTGRSYSDARKRYDWAEVQRFYDEPHTFRECRVRFGFSAASWDKAVRRGEIKPRRQKLPLETILAQSTRITIKRRLLRSGLIKNRCDQCGISEWRGRPLSIQIDHINGQRNDNRLENLRMLCPNCHSQTDTFGARNAAKKRALLGPV